MKPTSTTRARLDPRPSAFLLALRRAVGVTSAGIVFALVASACAAKQPAPGSDRPLGDVDSALQELDRAEGELAAIFPGLTPATPAYATPPVGAGAAAPPPQPVAPGPPPSPAMAPASPEQETPSPTQDSGGSRVGREIEDGCTTACRALASMERAATHLCDLAGQTDPRCEGARSRVTRASERVRSGCPSCG